MECKRCGHDCRFIALHSVYECPYCKSLFQPEYQGSVDEVITELNRYSSTSWDGRMGNECRVPKNLLIRASELLNTRRGIWLNTELVGGLEGHTEGECSVCHKVRIVDNYCPNCGTRMNMN